MFIRCAIDDGCPGLAQLAGLAPGVRPAPGFLSWSQGLSCPGQRPTYGDLLRGGHGRRFPRQAVATLRRRRSLLRSDGRWRGGCSSTGTARLDEVAVLARWPSRASSLSRASRWHRAAQRPAKPGSGRPTAPGGRWRRPRDEPVGGLEDLADLMGVRPQAPPGESPGCCQ